MVTTVLDLSEDYLRPNGHSPCTLGALKKSLDQFFDEHTITHKTIQGIRRLLDEGRCDSRSYAYVHPEYGNIGCLVGLCGYTLGYSADTMRTEFSPILNSPLYDFERYLEGLRPGMTPQNTASLAQLDRVLALCAEERAT